MPIYTNDCMATFVEEAPDAAAKSHMLSGGLQMVDLAGDLVRAGEK
jgi:hypothetical protein